MSRFDATWYESRAVRHFSLGALALAACAFPLVRVHTLFSCLVIPFGYLVGFVVGDVVSQVVFGRPFNPPRRHGAPAEGPVVHWSDWLLHALAILCMLAALFAMGSFADHVRSEDVWKW